jgi:hypothetical protein
VCLDFLAFRSEGKKEEVVENVLGKDGSRKMRRA